MLTLVYYGKINCIFLLLSLVALIEALMTETESQVLQAMYTQKSEGFTLISNRNEETSLCMR